MIEYMQQTRGERQRGGRRHVEDLEGERETETDEDDPDIFNGVVSEQALEVVLHQRVENAEQRRARPGDQHGNAPPPVRRPRQIKNNPDEGVDRDLGHHAAHQRRNVARRGRMGERQPDVQRDEARFRAGADQRENQHPGGDARARVRRAHDGKLVTAVDAGEQAESEQQGEDAEARHDDIDEAGAGVFRLAMMRHDERPGGERHEFPAHEKHERVVGERHETHAREKRGIEREHPFGIVFVAPVAERKEARRRRAQIDYREEERRQRVEPEMGADPGQADRQHESLWRFAREQEAERRDEPDQRYCQGAAINECARKRAARDRDGGEAQSQQRHLGSEQQPEVRHLRPPEGGTDFRARPMSSAAGARRICRGGRSRNWRAIGDLNESTGALAC